VDSEILRGWFDVNENAAVELAYRAKPPPARGANPDASGNDRANGG
jgi:hypothetical protein